MLESGRIAGFVGRNGAGKTTTIKSMLNLIHPDSGEITYFGMPLTGNEAQIKQRIGYSTGTVSWYPRKKLKEIVRVTKSFYPNWDDDFYDRYRKLFQLDENKMPLELSEGMKVKFNLLLALSHKAELLILDEPTSGLDPFSRDEILDIFGRREPPCFSPRTSFRTWRNARMISSIFLAAGFRPPCRSRISLRLLLCRARH